MKRLLSFFAALALALAAFAQTPEEIIGRMEAEMDKHTDEGLVMTMKMKIPILGTTVSKSYTLGDKYCIVTEIKGERIIIWTDGEAEWTYKSTDNTVEIKKDDGSAADEAGDAEMLSGITEGYDVSLKKETDTAWYFNCKKSRDNKEKDVPKNMELVIAKGTYYPLGLKVKMSGVTLTMEDFQFGVTEKQVTFNEADFPGVTVKDLR